MLGALALAATAIVIAIAAHISATRVASSARDIAGSEPYCIQVPAGSSDYRPARSSLDLSPWAAWAEPHGRHHAILIVGEGFTPRFYHWSYRQGAFEPGIVNEQFHVNWPAIACKPAHQLAGKQPLSPVDSDYIRLASKGTYRIPTEWLATWAGGMNPGLRFVTTAPDFRSPVRFWYNGLFGGRDASSVSVAWHGGTLVRFNDSSGSPVEQGTEFGLTKTKRIYHERNGSEYVQYRFSFRTDDRNGTMTVIACDPTGTSSKACEHLFLNNGRDFTFYHRMEDLADWRGMQQRLLALVDSFKVENGAP
jgi:hypothetical protein